MRIYAHTYPNLFKALLFVAHDNGAPVVNDRFEVSVTVSEAETANAALARLSQDELEDLANGDVTQQEATASQNEGLYLASRILDRYFLSL